LLWSTAISDLISALYMESTENILLTCWFHQNSLEPGVNQTKAKRWIKAFDEISLGRLKSLMNVTFRGEAAINVVMLSLLWRTMLYKSGYNSMSMVLPSHLSSYQGVYAIHPLLKMIRSGNIFSLPSDQPRSASP
jgi:hypothetical protein